MLRHLSINNLALFESAALELDAGLIAITGETGSGKSMVLDALSIIGGGRAGAASVRAREERASVEALFDLGPVHPARVWLSEQGYDTTGEELIIRREILKSGRSRSWINGRLAPISDLQQLGAHLVEIQSQHDQHTLLQLSAQRDLYDDFLGLASVRASVLAAYNQAQGVLAKLAAMELDERDRAQRADFLRFQVEELEGLELSPGEVDRLETECRRQGHIEELRRCGAGVMESLSDSQGSGNTARDALASAMKCLQEMARHDAALGHQLQRLGEAFDIVGDVSYEIGRYLAALDDQPLALDQINERLHAIKRALRKHGPSEEEALARLVDYKEELATLDNWDSRREEAARELAQALETLGCLSEELAHARQRGREKFEGPLAAILRDFAMPSARIEVSLVPLRQGVRLSDGRFCGPGGTEEVEILFSANAGEEPAPLRRVASGGELSRIMLALKTMAARADWCPTLVFDEIDAGISGSAATAVAERLAALGESHQILCVTHNASVASAASSHLIVEKHEAGGRTTSQVSAALGTRRQAELARLLDGGRRTSKGLELAAQMLERVA